MLICAINGSPNPDGNTESLVKTMLSLAVERGFSVTELFPGEIFETVEPFCTACTNPCTGICYAGSALEKAFEVMSSADGVIIASPVYFGTVSAQLKSFFDKTRKLRMEKRLLNIPGMAVSTGASRFGGQETTLRAIHDIMLVHGMIVLGDGFDTADCGHHGVCGQKPAVADETAHTRARIAAERLFQLAESTRPLRAARASIR
jgi:multimeric flavodoxin WrbA